MAFPVLRLTTVSLAASLLLASALPSIALAQPAASTTDTSRGLSIQYAGGRITTRPLRPSGGMWTPEFPRMTGVDTSREGLRLAALDVRYVVDGRDVVVTVSLSYGSPTNNEVKVATVRVAPDRPVRVHELRAFGVEPITLSLVPIPATVEYAPEAFSMSGQVDVRAETVGPNASAYRLVVRNRSSLALMWFHFKAYRGDRTAISGRPRGKRNLPLILPNAEYTYEVTASTVGAGSGDSPGTWAPLDRIEITSLMWQDGLVEGDMEPALQQGRFDANRATQIRALMTLLRGARERSAASLRDDIARAMTFDLETRQFRDSLLADLDAFEPTQLSAGGQDLDAWLTKAIAECQQWVARIVVPKF